jgi:hypothetical protein
MDTTDDARLAFMQNKMQRGDRCAALACFQTQPACSRVGQSARVWLMHALCVFACVQLPVAGGARGCRQILLQIRP